MLIFEKTTDRVFCIINSSKSKTTKILKKNAKKKFNKI